MTTGEIRIRAGDAAPGGSEGAYYAAQLAAADPRVAGIALLAGSVRRGEEILAWQTAQIARVTVPVLAVTGGHDLQVPPDDVAAMGRLVQGPFEGHVVGELSHLLRPDPGPVGPRGYRKSVRQPVSQQVLALITDWIARHWGARAAVAPEHR